ncbi:MAG TPA: hypothetical protein VK524_03785, partial [Polyangiaceae bacterium]|nr:hypothetical protein [Polyangiaceae bacterium]
MLARPVFYFATLLGEAWLVLAHEIFVRQPEAYLSPGFGPPAWLVQALAACSFAFGAWASHGRSGDPRARFTGSLLALSVCVAASAPLLFWSFAHHVAFAIASVGVPVLIATLLGLGLHAGLRALGGVLAGFHYLPWVANPFRLLTAGALSILALIAASNLGMWRAACGLGMVLAVLAGWAPALFAYLDRASFPGARRVRRVSFASLAGALALLGVSLEFTPPSDHLDYPSEVVFARRAVSGRYVVTSGQQNLDLFRDRMLKASSIDDYRFAESLVHPALSARPLAKRVLLLGSGDGLIEREMLRYPEVSELYVFAPDAALAKLSLGLSWLKAQTDDAMASSRVRLRTGEPSALLEATPGSFDVILVDLPDPIDYVEGKHYTSYFYGLLRSRLADGGVGVVQATSISSTPRTFTSIKRSLEAAGLFTLPYHAALPSLGDWGFILFSRRPPALPRSLPANLRFL